MPQPLERRRKVRRKAVQPTGPTWVMLENVPGARADVRAKVVDFSETGLRVHVSLWLRATRLVVVKGDIGVVPNGKANARVVDCFFNLLHVFPPQHWPAPPLSRVGCRA